MLVTPVHGAGREAEQGGGGGCARVDGCVWLIAAQSVKNETCVNKKKSPLFRYFRKSLKLFLFHV